MPALHSQRFVTRCSAIALLALILLAPTTAQLSGTHLIPRHNSRARIATKQTIVRTFAVGDTLTVPAFSFQLVGGGLYTTTTTCRHVGDNLYIFVEDEIASRPQVNAAAIAEIGEAFDNTTRADADRGIYDIVTDLYGNPPDVDGDPRVLVVLLDILDSPFTGSTFIGYYDTNNQTGQALREIIYVDPIEGASNALPTLAHEFQHMIHWAGDPDEDKWVDEGCSEYAELACGYKDTTETAGETFLMASNVSLTLWEDLPFDFDQTYLFTTYFAQRFGESALMPLVQQDANSIDGMNIVLDAIGNVRYEELFFDWTAATFFDADGKFGYERIDLGAIDRDTVSVASRIVRSARKWGSDYIVLDQPGQYDVTLESLGDNDVAAVLLMDSPAELGQIAITAPAGGTESVTLYTEGLVAVCVTSMSGSSEQYAMAFASSSIDGSSAQATDADRDGDVDFEDFLIFAEHFGDVAGRLGYDPTFDYNGDRTVAFTDFLIFATHFGTTF